MSTQATHSKNSQGLHNVDPPKWLGLVTDVVLWIFLFFLFSLLLYIFVIRPQQASQQTVSLTFKDANEVSRGALVRMMGTDIGYVDNIRINKEKVNIVVKTEPGGITIPENSTFTVNFTGLVGAKSIEVIPPNNPTTGREQRQGKFFLEEPIRFRDAQKYQIDIAKALQSGAENFADFFGKQQPIPVLQKNIHKAEVITAHVNDMMREADRTVKTRGAEVHSGLSKIGHVVEDFSISSRAVAKSTGQNDFGPNVLSVLAKLSKGVLRGQRDMAAFVHERHLQRYQHTAAQMNEAFDEIEVQVAPPLLYTHVYSKWNNLNNGMSGFDQQLGKANKAIQPNVVLRQFQQFSLVIQQFNFGLVHFSDTVDKKMMKK